MTSFYTDNELIKIGFKKIGNNVLISRNACFYSPENISIDDNVRIDDFCILSGKITIGKYVHISAGSFLFAGDQGITLNDFSGLSSRCAVYAISDDYSGDYLTNPMVPSEYRHIIGGNVIIGRHVVIGSGTTILPNVKICDGASIGCMSLVNKSIDDCGIYIGIPVHKLKERNKRIYDLEKQLINQ